MNRWAYLTILIAVIAMTGCRSSSSSHRHDDRPLPPELDAFHMVDSYGLNTELEPFLQPALTPFIASGEFEVFWDVYNEDDYIVELSINDRPGLLGRRLISQEICGPGLECDLFGELYCEYNQDFSISCDLPSEPFPGQNLTYFNDWVDINRLPQTLYFILDVCDTNSDICEFQVLDVSME